MLFEPNDDDDDDAMVVRVESFLMVPCQSGIEPSLVQCKLFKSVAEEQQPPIETDWESSLSRNDFVNDLFHWSPHSETVVI